MARPRDGHACFQEHLARKFIGDVSRVLDRVIEGDFIQPMKALGFGGLIEVEREPWLVIDWTEAACRALQMNRDIGVNHRALSDGRGHWNPIFRLGVGAPVVAPQCIDPSIGDFNLELEHVIFGEEEFVQLGFLART